MGFTTSADQYRGARAVRRARNLVKKQNEVQRSLHEFKAPASTRNISLLKPRNDDCFDPLTQTNEQLKDVLKISYEEIFTEIEAAKIRPDEIFLYSKLALFDLEEWKIRLSPRIEFTGILERIPNIDARYKAGWSNLIDQEMGGTWDPDRANEVMNSKTNAPGRYRAAFFALMSRVLATHAAQAQMVVVVLGPTWTRELYNYFNEIEFPILRQNGVTVHAYKVRSGPGVRPVAYTEQQLWPE